MRMRTHYPLGKKEDKMKCVLYTVVLAIFSCGVSAQPVNPDALKTEKMFIEKMEQLVEASRILRDTVGIPDYDCDLDAEEPDDIHELSPEFVDVVAAMGDSVTAGFGALSTDISEIAMQFRGVSWTIGGDASLEEVATLPNILEEFNPYIKGASRLVGPVEYPNSRLNLAVGGSQSEQMLGQAQDLVARMEEIEDIDEQWKVISIWIGGNDLCDIEDDGTTPENHAEDYIENVKDALDYLYNHVERAFVNLILVVDISGMTEFEGRLCDFVQENHCLPLLDEDTLEIIEQTQILYNAELQKLIAGGTTYDRSDFTVVIQPFLSETEFPTYPPDHTEPDMSYFALDCFHFSQKGHAVVARYLWNNMFQPVGEKTRSIDWDSLEPLTCPESYPYFATYKNSKRGKEAKKEL